MPQKDAFHDTVKRALERDGWRIVGEQVYLFAVSRGVWIDLKAELVSGNNHQQIAFIEVKEFNPALSIVTQLHHAIGQYVVYRTILRNLNIDLPLYLAVPQKDYLEIWADEPARWVIEQENVKMVIIEEAAEVVTQWIL